jgi:hypothetical protein
MVKVFKTVVDRFIHTCLPSDVLLCSSDMVLNIVDVVGSTGSTQLKILLRASAYLLKSFALQKTAARAAKAPARDASLLLLAVGLLK